MKGKNLSVAQLLYKYRQLLILAALCIFFAAALPGMFFTMSNFRSILYSMSLYGLMICGATFPVLLGGIDRTVGAVAALSGAICCMIIVNSGYTNQGVVLGILAGVGVGMLSGIIHGVIVAHFTATPYFFVASAESMVT